MTKREFDALTKRNSGWRCGLSGKWFGGMARDEREDYRALRRKDDSRAPLLERRAEYLARRGMSPLWRGSPFRVPADHAARCRA